ncbi:calcium/sodium antiporter [Erythrobacter sp. HKB08]|uniref:calcium/sodium antiporter n=1 Tax=Erythrobacter sp. HKB08 TaxID=2502843 RepID=UPI001008E571|nr:calcium/sodium antiporter [Erythrobacter sp. HKB08]
MGGAILLVLGGLVGLAIGGELLVRGSVGIARYLKISSLITGLVIVGFATSMPEMVASIQAAMIGSPGIAWGNIVGSNIANSLLILGSAALIAPIALTGLGKRDANVALGATVLLVVLAYLQIGHPLIGAGLLFCIVAYIVWRYTHPRSLEEDDDGEDGPQRTWLAVLFFLAGLAILIFAGKILVDGAVDLARLFGLSETAIGLTIVAVGTSLPELAASVAAAWRGRSGLALGNVIGSNIYNILLIGGATMSIAPGALPADILGLELGLLLVSAIAIAALMWRAPSISRPVGGLLVLIFFANTGLLLLQ